MPLLVLPVTPAVMKRVLAGLLLGSVLALGGCDSSTDPDAFLLSAFDPDERLVLVGELRLSFGEEGPEDGLREVSGTWTLDGRGGYPTPQPASGGVRGEVHLNAIELHLLQDVSDAGFALEGSYDGDRIVGAWSTVTIAGPVAQGTFEAVRE